MIDITRAKVPGWGDKWSRGPWGAAGPCGSFRPMRARTGSAAIFGSLLLLLAPGGCEATNLGETPPDQRLFFPSGVLLDPVQQVVADPTSADQMPPVAMDLPGPRYLYVANGNNDRTFNSGTLVAVDLQAFWRAWYDPHRDDPAQPGCLAAIAAGDVGAARAACDARDPRRGGADPFCHDDADASDPAFGRCVLGPGSFIDESAIARELRGDGADGREPSCRRLPLLPHVVECDEQRFITNTVHVGDFAATLAASVEPDGNPRLWLPVRGDPSIAYIDVVPGADQMLRCGQGGDPLDELLCGDEHRLSQLRNDESLAELQREPFNTLIWERDDPSPDPDARGQRLGFIAHADGAQLSVVDLDGVRGETEPAIVDFAPVYSLGLSPTGGFGLAVRPCYAQGEGPLGAADPEPNIPAVTQGCTRPLMYSSMRFAGRLVTFTASGLDVGGAAEALVPAAQRVDCHVGGLRSECRIEATEDVGGTGDRIVCDRLFDREKCCPAGATSDECAALPAEQITCCEGERGELDDASALACATDCSGGDCPERTYAGPYCATPAQLGQPCAVECEPRVRASRQIQPSLLLDSSLQFSPILGDMAFADPRGDQLLVLQTNPGALLSLDTSLGDDGEPLDIPSAPPVEICAEPSRMKIYTERDENGVPLQRYALISCFRAALVYVVDLEALRVVDAIVVGTGPFDLAIDESREVAYVINNLEFSVSVIDLSRRRPTRFQELARLGLQDPFSQ